MGIDDEITSYLRVYGNTKEIDLMNYGMQQLGRSSEDMKKIIDRMVIKEKIHRIVHNKLKPPDVYISLQEPLLPFEVEMELAKAQVKAEAQKILQEAAAIAERKKSETDSGKF
jgi:hypothetical protein